MLGEIIDPATIAGTLTGGVVGLGLELQSSHVLASNRQAIAGTHDQLPSDDYRYRPLRHAIGSIVLSATALGFSIGEAATFTSSLQESGAALTTAVDHTATLTTRATTEINDIAKKFSHDVSKSLDLPKPFVAHDSTVDRISFDKLAGDITWGQSNFMATAVNSALESANSTAAVGEKSDGILIFTDDDPIGDIKSEDPINLPLYIVNVGPKSQTLINDANETGGKYIAAEDVNTEEVVNEIRGYAKFQPVVEKSTEGRWPWGVVSVFLAGITYRRYRRHKRETVGESIVS